MPRHGPGKHQVDPFGVGRCALGDNLAAGTQHGAIVPALHQHAARNRLQHQAGPARIGQFGEQQAQILFACKDLQRVLIRARGDHHFGEDASDGFRRRAVERLVDRNDAAKGRDRIAPERLFISISQSRPGGDAARIGVLDDGAGRAGIPPFGDEVERTIGIVQVVVTQLLALHLARRGNAITAALRQVERGLLARVFAITQRLLAGERDGQHGREHFALIGKGEPTGDGGIIGSGVGKGCGGEAAAQSQWGGAVVRIQRGDELIILVGAGQDGDEIMVLGGGADHGGAADVDILDDFVPRRTLGDGGGERVKVDHGQIDGADAIVGPRLQMVGSGAKGEQAAVDARVQRLHTAVHHFGAAGQFGDILQRVAERPQGSRRAAGGHQLHTACHQGGSQRLQPGLVGHRKQGTANGNEVGHGERLSGAVDEFAPA